MSQTTQGNIADPVVIVGAGIAGLICAIELRRLGRTSIVFEAGSAVGGRVRTSVVNGVTLDHGFQVLFTAYPTLNAYLDRDALRLRPFLPAARIVRDGHVSLIGDALRDPALLVDTVLSRAVSIGDKLRLLALRRFAQQLSIDECFGARFDSVSTSAFLESRGFGPAVIDGFFAPFYGGILLDRTLSTSASILLFTFKMLAEGTTAVPALGMGAISAQLAAQLSTGTVRLDSAVHAITSHDGYVSGVMLRDGSHVAATQVVLATEPPAAAKLAATVGVTLTVPTGARGCTTLYYTTPRSPLPGKALWLNAEAQAIISHAVTLTDVAPEYATGQSLIAATALGEAAELSDELLDAAAQREIRAMARANGDARDTSLTRLAIWRVPYAQFAQPPGWREQRPTIACGFPGLWRASEVLHSSSLEGAARGGQSAARALASSALASSALASS